ncbi:MAG: nucleoside-diphosphate sugar epimerase/dehydratase, partial [Nitrospinales bacterium]
MGDNNSHDALVHTLARNALMALRERGVNLRQVLIVGTGALGQAVAEKIDLHPEIGFSVAGFLTLRTEEIGGAVKNYKVLGLTQDISKHIKEQKIDQLFIALPLDARRQMEQTLDSLGTETVDIKVVPDLLRFMNLHSGVEDFDGLPVVNLTGTPLYGWNSVIKRTADIVCSSV